MNQYLGRAKIKANGVVLDTKPGASLDLGGIQRDSVVNEHSMGFTETPKPARLECELALKRGDSVEQFRNLTDATIVFECDTGQSYIAKGGYTTETISLSSNSVKLVFMAQPAQEMVS